MRTSVWTPRSAGEHHATTPWGASAASVPLALTMSRPAGVAQMSTSAPPPRTPANLDAQTQMEVISVVVPLDTSEQDKGMLVDYCVWKAAFRCSQLTRDLVIVLGTVSQVWALVVVALVLDREVRWMIILCLLRPATNVKSMAIPRRDANVVAPTQHRRILWKTCR